MQLEDLAFGSNQFAGTLLRIIRLHGLDPLVQAVTRHAEPFGNLGDLNQQESSPGSAGEAVEV